MMRLVLCGFGFMGRMHASVLRSMPGAQVVGVVDLRGEEIRGAVRESGWENIPLFPELAPALAACTPDAVLICLPTDLHREAAEMAFAAGCHVFCEKPVAKALGDAGFD